MNAAKSEDGGKDDSGEEAQLLTYALRIKNPAKLAEFTAVVNEHKSGTKKVRGMFCSEHALFCYFIGWAMQGGLVSKKCIGLTCWEFWLFPSC